MKKNKTLDAIIQPYLISMINTLYDVTDQNNIPLSKSKPELYRSIVRQLYKLIAAEDAEEYTRRRRYRKR